MPYSGLMDDHQNLKAYGHVKKYWGYSAPYRCLVFLSMNISCETPESTHDQSHVLRGNTVSSVPKR